MEIPEEAGISKFSKGIGTVLDCDTPIIPTAYVKSAKWNLLNEDLPLPVAVLDIAKVGHNLDWMDSFLKNTFDSKILLAPHGKTSMMPAVFQKIFERSSTWGLTVGTAVQVRTAHAHGISRIIMANQLVGRQNLEIISEIKSKDTAFDFSCLVDTPDIVNLLGQFFSSKGQTINVLLEYGLDGGRTGVRNESVETQTLEALQKWSGTIKLVGVEFYEGVIDSEPVIRNFIESTLSRTKELYNQGVFGSDSFILTGAGTAWFYLVAEMFSKFSKDNPEIPLQLIIRPGCYVIHDIGRYNETALRVQTLYETPETLTQTLTIWAYVQSTPEPNLVILNFGKRDAAMDCGYPRPSMHFRPQPKTDPESSPSQPSDVTDKGWRVIRMMDQHTFLEINDNDDLVVGDIVVFNITHPCTTIDKWRHIFVVDSFAEGSPYEIVDVYPTYF